MAPEWPMVGLGDLYEFRSGLSKPRSAFGSGYPFLSFKDVFYNVVVPRELSELVNSTEKERVRCSIRAGDVFLTRTSETQEELGMSSVALRSIPDATFNGFTKRLRPKAATPIDPRYAAYYFRSPDFRRAVGSMSSLSTRASLNNEMLSRLTMPLPSLETQRRVGAILGALDDKIDLNRRMSQSLDNIAGAVFEDWFAGPTLEGLPEGWALRQVSDVAVVNGHTLSARTELGSIRYVEISAVSRGTIDATPTYARSDAPSRARRMLRHGDTVISTVRPDRGAYFLALDPPADLIASSGFATITPSHVPWAYLHAAVTRAAVFERLGALADGGAYPAVSAELVGSQSLPVPGDAALMDDFQSVAEPLYRRAAAGRAEAQTLAQLRDSLLPRLLSGDLPVGD